MQPGVHVEGRALLRTTGAHADRASNAARTTVPSPTYEIIAQAMASRRQIVCVYDGYRRGLCPFVLGHTKGAEVALCFQFSGASRSGLPPEGQWKCLRVAKMRDVRLRDGPWRGDARHLQRQNCVEVVDLDANPSSPFDPSHRIEALSASRRSSAVRPAGSARRR